MTAQKLRAALLWSQGSYTLLTAVWPIVHIKSFMDVSGYKTDIWLVKTVGILLAAIAVCLLLSISSKENFPVAVLGLFTAAGMAYVDFFYALNDTIPDIYMADGAVEILFVLVWMYLLVKGSKKPAAAG
ncbi:MAG TPA: hypothetical protein VER36_10240 [Flavisolibacter sp.]|nr:hypothetical protein [Flavisolibacter sp.]